MLPFRSRGLNAILSAIAVFVACALFWFVAKGFFVLVLGRELAHLSTYAICTTVIGLALLINGMRVDLNQVEIAELGPLGAARLSLSQVISVLFALLLVLAAIKDVSLSRTVLAVYIPVLFISLFAVNRVAPRLVARLFFSGGHEQKTLVIGSAEAAAGLSAWMARQRAYGTAVVGLLSDDPLAASACPSIPFLGPLSGLEEQIGKTGCSQVMLIGLPPSSAAIKTFAQICEAAGARFLVIADWARVLGRKLAVNTEQGMHILSFQREPLQCPWNRSLKRALDLAIATPVVFLVLPLMSAIVWLLQRSQSPGPLFFRQKRTGAFGRPFWIFKYRSMHVNHGDEARQAERMDERVFPAGKLLRKLSLDELPQFINVFRGEMSVVGPRPHLAEHDLRFQSHMRRYRIRHLVKPGITGLAQIRGYRGETRAAVDIVRRVRADLKYIQEWSLGLDMFIVARTALTVLRPPKSSY